MDIFIENPRPVEDKTLAILILVLNIVPLPGVGTLIYNLQTKDDKWINALVPMVLGFTGVLWIVGVVWAVIDGIKIYQASEATRQTAGGPGTTATWTTVSEPASDAPATTEDPAGAEKRSWERVPEPEAGPEAEQEQPPRQ